MMRFIYVSLPATLKFLGIFFVVLRKKMTIGWDTLRRKISRPAGNNRERTAISAVIS
jgi:hypothetical protein